MFWHLRQVLGDLIKDPYGVLKKKNVKLNPCGDLTGDRDIEWSWIVSNMPTGAGHALDFGNGGGPLGLAAALRGYDVTAVDLADVQWPYQHDRLRFVRGDLLTMLLPDNHYNLVLNCSTVEHVGLTGRYGVTDNRTDGDLEAMKRLRQLMKPDGIMLLTVPVGKDAVFKPMCRVYGKQRLPLLLRDFTLQKAEYWVKTAGNEWAPAERPVAWSFPSSMGSQNPTQNTCALGCFVLCRHLP